MIIISLYIILLLTFERGSLAIVKFETVNVKEIIDYIKSGDKCLNIIQEFIDRIEAFNKKPPTINAVISLNPRVLDEARELDTLYANSGQLKGPLHCIPILIKDNIDVRSF